jgi:hypothetical protein
MTQVEVTAEILRVAVDRSGKQQGMIERADFSLGSGA